MTIQCPSCEWQPDGKPYWKCSCGHSWNTFDTKAKCPVCNTQWEKTYCPGCKNSTPHTDWYIGSNSLTDPKASPEILELKKRKKLLESRLIALGIKNCRVSHLPYLQYHEESFQTPYHTGCRLMILYAMVYAVHQLEKRPKLIDWLKEEHLWEQVSNKEKEFLQTPKPTQEELQRFSWRLESALTLGWVLRLFDDLHEIDREETEDELDLFTAAMPQLGTPTKAFLENLSYRNLEEIHIENLVNELATGYFRDLFFNGEKDETTINRAVSFERHQVLNWVRQFSGISDWDNVDTST